MPDKFDKTWEAWPMEVEMAIKSALEEVVDACRYASNYWQFMEEPSLSLDLSPFSEEGWTIDVPWEREGVKDGVPYFVNRKALGGDYTSQICRELDRGKYKREEYEIACHPDSHNLASSCSTSLAKVLALVNKYLPEKVAALLQALDEFAKEIRRLGNEARERAKEALGSPEAQMIRRKALEKALEDTGH